VTAGDLSTAAAAAGVGRAARSRSVLVEKADATGRYVTVIAEILTEVTAAVDIASKTHGILQQCTIFMYQTPYCKQANIFFAKNIEYIV